MKSSRVLYIKVAKSISDLARVTTTFKGYDKSIKANHIFSTETILYSQSIPSP